jgi:hypothetical protein
MKYIFILGLLFFNLSCVSTDILGEKPIIIGIAGQSNAVGTGDMYQSPANILNTFEYNSKLNQLEPLKDPVGQFHLNFEAASTGSFSPALAQNLMKITNNKIFIIQCAKGGSALHHAASQNNWGVWDETGKLLENSFKKIDNAFLKINQAVYKTPILDALIWSQGENDGRAIGIGMLTREEYKNALKNLITHFRNKYGAELPFIIIETGRDTSCLECDEGFKIVRQVQREVANEDTYTFIGYNETEFFEERNWLSGSLHYNQTALNDIGEKLATFIIANKIID